MSPSPKPQPYTALAEEFARLIQRGQSLPLGGWPAPARPPIAPDAPKALFFAPHPDDETISGGFALRLLREAHWRIINVAVTQGSKPERKAARFEELKGACAFLGFELKQTAPEGLDDVNAKTRRGHPETWAANVQAIASILAAERPQAIFCPHEFDWNGTHIGTHFVVMDALREVPGLECAVIEMEFWGQMDTPNLLVEYTAAEVGDLLAATTFHVGEVRRNPYHITTLAWMLDNVRRGAELVGGQGGAAPNFLFAQLFRLRHWKNGRLEAPYQGGRFLTATERADSLLAV